MHVYFVALFMEIRDLQSSAEMFCMQGCNLPRNVEMLQIFIYKGIDVFFFISGKYLVFFFYPLDL